jgi:hypothetical protein
MLCQEPAVAAGGGPAVAVAPTGPFAVELPPPTHNVAVGQNVTMFGAKGKLYMSGLNFTATWDNKFLRLIVTVLGWSLLQYPIVTFVFLICVWCCAEPGPAEGLHSDARPHGGHHAGLLADGLAGARLLHRHGHQDLRLYQVPAVTAGPTAASCPGRWCRGRWWAETTSS